MTREWDDWIRTLTRGMAAEASAASDAELVRRFLETGEDGVFEVLVRRHGLMVYRVCRRVAGRDQGAEDAFQATFLVLARNLRALRNRASLASWLHGIARRVALKARSRRTAERLREAAVAVPDAARTSDPTWSEVRAILDEELACLPDRLRAPLVLCLLEGRTQDEAARTLGWSKRTVRRRLEHARAVLADRLTRRGVWPAALPAALLFECDGVSAVPPPLAGRVIESLNPSGTVPAGVIDLTKGVVPAMSMWKAIAAVMVSAAVVFSVVVVAASGSASARPDPPARAESQKPGESRTVMVPLDKLKENGVSYDPAAMTAPVVYQDLMLVLVGADGAAAVVFGKADDAEVSVEYRYRYQSRDGKQTLSGTGTVKGGQVSDLKAGPITVQWSWGSVARGWVYYNLKSVHVHMVHARVFDDRVEDLIPPFPDGRKVTWPKVDLATFMQAPTK